MIHYSHKFLFDLSSQDTSSPPLRITAKRYRASSTPLDDGLTLLFLHCLGTFKEHWEPIIDYLFSMSHLKIREAWAFDSPSHGDAGVLNRESLEKQTKGASTHSWVAGIVQFLKSECMKGHRIVICGHSVGATISVLTATEVYLDFSSVNIIGMILIEPIMMQPQTWKEDFKPRRFGGLALVSSRKESWKSKQEALSYFQNQREWSTWDPRILRLHAELGLYELSDGTVALKCYRKFEKEAYVDMNPHVNALTCLGKLCRGIPVHTVWGERKNFVPVSAQVTFSDTTKGRPMASISTVARAGHMVAQEQPIGLAKVIGCILRTNLSISGEMSRL